LILVNADAARTGRSGESGNTRQHRSRKPYSFAVERVLARLRLAGRCRGFMKIFWSWQSDTQGKVGRHFVRDTLWLAIDTLKQPPDVEEPTAAEARGSIHLDQDRQDVTGSPDLARTIFAKIDRAAVFVADVTLVGTSDDGSKRLINPNVAIEYGYAHHALGDEAILMVQNTHFGDRDALPFDLKHKAGPIQYRLAPEAEKTEIEEARKSLARQFITALRPFVERQSPRAAAPFKEQASTDTPAVFFAAGDLLGCIGIGTEDEIEYRFAEPQAFYLRLMPTVIQPELKHTTLMDIAGTYRPDVLSRSAFDGSLDRNGHGVIALTPSGKSTTPTSFTQLFPTGEAWGVTRNFFNSYRNMTVLPVIALENVYRRVLANYIGILEDGFRIALPYKVVFGGIGLRGAHAGLNGSVDGPIYKDRIETRRILRDASKQAQEEAVREFADAILDMAGARRS
jgi:hypothetical protein